MLEQIEREDARAALESVARRVEQYGWLLKALPERDVSEDRHFRRAYLSYYKLRQKDREFLRFYFDYLETHKSRHITFEQAFLAIYRRFGIFDPASASKLAATVDPNLPVWDSQILGSLGIRPLSLERDRCRAEKTLDAYDRLCAFYGRYLSSRSGRMAVALFEEVYPGTGFTPIKKADFVLWSVLWS